VKPFLESTLLISAIFYNFALSDFDFTIEYVSPPCVGGWWEFTIHWMLSDASNVDH